MNNNLIDIVVQGFYGNRTGTSIRKEEFDKFICDKPTDRTVIPIPNIGNVVIIYNKYNEAEWLEKKKKVLEEDGYELRYTAYIPELNLKLYSRCVVCRIDEHGEVASLEDEDYEHIFKYLAE